MVVRRRSAPHRLIIDTLTTHSYRLLGLVVLTGIVGGLISAAYIASLQGLTHVLGPGGWSGGTHLLVLAGVGVSITLLIKYLGNPGDVELLVNNIHVLGGPEDTRSLAPLIPVSLLGISAGSTLGPEAPLVQATGTIGTWMARRWRVDRSAVRIVTITGMAAGFTALFGAPVGSAFFALEILHRRGLEYYEALLPAVLGSLSGYAVYITVTGWGLRPIWHFPTPPEIRPVDMLWALGAGVVAAALAHIFTWLTLGWSWCFKRIPTWVRPTVGGLILGLAALVTPYALTNGELQIVHMTGANIAVGTLLLAALAKFLMAAMIGPAGWRGGFIIPLFFVGFCLGELTHAWMGSANEWVMVPAFMVALNVGVTKTPIGSTLVVTEMAGLAVLPTTLLAAVVGLMLTSDSGLIHTQRRREPADAQPGDAEVHGGNRHHDDDGHGHGHRAGDDAHGHDEPRHGHRAGDDAHGHDEPRHGNREGGGRVSTTAPSGAVIVSGPDGAEPGRGDKIDPRGAVPSPTVTGNGRAVPDLAFARLARHDDAPWTEREGEAPIREDDDQEQPGPTLRAGSEETPWNAT
jgi:H+/Cl- antiporter ClcA